MYKLDPNTARKADQTGRSITELGKYIGKFTQAVDVTAATGTKGIALTFENTEGQTTRLSLYTKKKDGTELMGLQSLFAIMTCMKLRDIAAPSKGRIKKWDYDTKAEVEDDALVFPELTNKPIGLLLETADYIKKDGGTGTRMEIAGIFEPAGEFTASEILDQKTKPEQLAKLVARLRHRPVKGAKAAAASNGGAPAGGGFDDMDDDIPFVSASPMFDMVPSKARRMARYDF